MPPELTQNHFKMHHININQTLSPSKESELNISNSNYELKCFSIRTNHIKVYKCGFISAVILSFFRGSSTFSTIRAATKPNSRADMNPELCVFSNLCTRIRSYEYRDNKFFQKKSNFLQKISCMCEIYMLLLNSLVGTKNLI
jgi:hypothetical protein